MGRHKGVSYRKHKLIEIPRIRCRGWTIPEDTLSKLSDVSCKLGVKESRIVEMIINDFLLNPSDKLINPAKVFTQN